MERKPKIVFKYIKEDIGFSAHCQVGDCSINTQGDSISELRANIVEATNLTFQEDGFTYSIDEIGLELTESFD